MTAAHLLSAGAWASLFAGGGDPAAITALGAAQLSKHLLLIRGLLDLAERVAPQAGAKAHLTESFEALCAVQSAAPGTVADLLSHPHVGAWAAHCVRRLRTTPEATSETPLWIDLAHLGAIAAAAAANADAEVEVLAPARFGTVALPTIGRACLDLGDPWHLVTVKRVRTGALTLRRDTDAVVVPADPATDGVRWQALRRLRAECAGLTLQLELDDLDPYRDCHRLGAAERLADDAVRHWQVQLCGAWSILATRHPSRAAAVAAGLRTLVPLVARAAGGGVSATSRYASGAAVLTPANDAPSLAIALIHEFQHTKLNALLDLVPLSTTPGRRLYYSPWRDDPRPVGGLLHGVYAFVAVVDFWRVERTAADFGPPDLATFEFARTRGQVQRGHETLSGCDELTSAGAALIAAVGATLTPWLDEQVRSNLRVLAENTLIDHAIRWRLRNVRPDADGLTRLTAARVTDAGPTPMPQAAAPVPAEESFTEDRRLVLARWWLARSASSQRPGDHPHAPATAAPAATKADLHLVAGEYAEAADAYVTEIADGADPVAAWSGLAVAHRRLAGTAAGLLAYRTELVRAVYDRQRTGSSAQPAMSPRDLAQWLDRAAVDDTPASQL